LGRTRLRNCSMWPVRLPGAVHSALPMGDHASPVMDVAPFKNYWSPQERNALTVALIAEVRRLGRLAPD
ncbi:MAG: hypothetical protein ACN4G0_16825, partial [Polyangiales bacterium]